MTNPKQKEKKWEKEANHNYINVIGKDNSLCLFSFIRKVRQEAIRETACWEWKGSKKGNGYGQIMIDGKNYFVHRLAYAIFHGRMPDSQLTIDHLCRNRSCVNPRHLELVPIKENVLRGKGITAINAKKTHCKRGHEFTDENTYLYKNYRCCRICRREDDKRRKLKQKYLTKEKEGKEK